MEWVEVTDATIEGAKEAALDHLGVDESLAQFEILDEPRKGLFGRFKGEARVRARVAPTQPRPKVERRRRRGNDGKPKKGDQPRPESSSRKRAKPKPDQRRSAKPGPDAVRSEKAPAVTSGSDETASEKAKTGKTGSDRAETATARPVKGATSGPDERATSQRSSPQGAGPDRSSSKAKTVNQRIDKTNRSQRHKPTTAERPVKQADEQRTTVAKTPDQDLDAEPTSADVGSVGGPAEPTSRTAATSEPGDDMSGSVDHKPKATGETMEDEDVTVEDQADIVWGFLEGLLDAFDADGEIESETIDDDTVELSVVGDGLGLLIGQKGATLQAIQELSRTAVQRQLVTAPGRVRLDIGEYRLKRRQALARFVTQQVELVLESGRSRALEAMNAADRKVVHDTVNGIDGAHTISEGQDPHRRVVILPDED